MCVHVVEICPKWKRNNRDTFNVFGRDLISCNFEGKNLEKMFHTGSQMLAMHDPVASIDMIKHGRKYGNLKVEANSKGL